MVPRLAVQGSDTILAVAAEPIVFIRAAEHGGQVEHVLSRGLAECDRSVINVLIP